MVKINHLFFRLSLLVVFIFCHNIGQAQKKKQHSLLYKVEKKGVTPFYIFGTIHMICEDQFTISPQLESVIENAKNLYLEIDMQQMNPFAVLNKAQSKVDIEKTLAPETLDSLKNFIQSNKAMQLPWMMVKTLQPMFIQQLMFQSDLGCKTESYDMYLNNKFKEAGKTIKGLETIDFQLDMMANIPHENQINYLLGYMRDPKNSLEQFQKLVNIYLRNDVNELEEMMNQDDPLLSGTLVMLLDDRNVKWVKIMNENIQAVKKAGNNEYTLYAFGAGHLGGKMGVIELLKKDGFKVKPVL